MDPELAGSLTATCCCLLMSALVLAPVGALAHWRMRKVEAELGRPALPADERALLFYAGASVVWLSAAIFALVGFARRDWSRVGRNCAWMFVAHFAAVVALALGSMTLDSVYGRDDTRVLTLLLPHAALCFAVAGGFAWRWAGSRAARIASEQPTGEAPAVALRWLAPLGAAVVWPLGVLALFVYNKPQDVWVGAWSFRACLAALVALAWIVCAGVLVLTRFV